MNKAKRYQECSLPIRVWRRRYYLAIPYRTYRLWVCSKYPQNFDSEGLTWGEAKAIATGLAQSNMGWYYFSDEVFAKLRQTKEKYEHKTT